MSTNPSLVVVGPPRAVKAAERIAGELKARPLQRTVTVSGGVAAFPDNAQNAADLLRAADAALYDAKKSGRNQVRGAGEGAAIQAAARG